MCFPIGGAGLQFGFDGGQGDCANAAADNSNIAIKTFMFPHLLIGGMVYSLTVGPWGYICLKLKWSAFRVFALWQLVTVGLLMPLLNCAAFSSDCWYLYNMLTWPARCITVITFGAVVGELLERLELGLSAGGLLGIAMIIGLGHDWIATAYRIAGLITAIVAAYAMRRPEKRALAAGLFVFALVPAISEMPSVLEYGGWLRMVPTISAWVAFAIWLSSRTPCRSSRPS